MGFRRAGIIMAFDHAMFHQGLTCIRQLRKSSVSGWQLSIVVLDLGLADAERRALAHAGVLVRPLDFPVAMFSDAPQHAKAMTCRPYLRDMFPEFEVCMWVDADIRVVAPDAIDAYVGTAAIRQQHIAIVQEVDPTYPFINHPAMSHSYHAQKRDRMREVYGEQVAEQFNGFAQFNAGIFAMHRDSVIWSSYRQNLERAVQTPFHHLKEQDALNVAIFQNNMAAAVLPTTYNWICSSSRPIYSPATRSWVRPGTPQTAVSILHLTQSNAMVEISGVRQPLYAFYKQMGLTD